LFLAYVAARTWRDYPALDRSEDHRPTQVLTDLTTGLDDRQAVFLADLNWQVQNGLSYFGKEVAPNLAYERMPTVMLYAPALVADNETIGRTVVLTDRARSELVDAYGPLLPTLVLPFQRLRTPSAICRTTLATCFAS
jgi:hypothetical protein